MKKKDVKNKIKREQKLNTSKKNYEQLLNRERLKKREAHVTVGEKK